jgi:hypothetical protein
MTWSSDTIAPPAPNGFRHDKLILSWQPAECDDTQNGGVIYNIYGSESWPVDIAKAENLLAARVRGTQFDLSASRRGKKRYFAITASDRFGNESAPAQEPKPKEALRQREDNLRIQPDGTIRFDNDSETTAVYVCSLTGERIRIATHADYIDVSMLPAGYYKLVRTLKGNRHKTIGVFMK